jgi:HD-GYP domain-containing protein (c-di-GMP phosphodiesterase class II)
MLRVPIASAVPGMVLAMPVLHPRRPGTVLLAAGLTLDEHIIGRLGEIRLRELWIRYPGVEFIGEYICPRIFENQAAVAQQIAHAFDAVTSHIQPRLEYNEYRNAVGELLDRLLARPRAAIFVQEISDKRRPALRHSASVCMLSLLMGLKLEDYLITERTRLSAPTARDVAGLGVAAMLHDIGTLRLSPEVLHRWERTMDDSDTQWQQHVHLGFDMVKEAIGPASAAAVLHHHQKFDGTGFPARLRLDGSEEPLSGKEIHVFARIIAAANFFDRLRHPPPAGPDAAPVPVVRVLNTLRQAPYSGWLDPMVFKALLAVVPAYAPGSIVTLSNGQRAVVTEWFPNDPCRPTVQIIGDLDPGAAPDSQSGERIVLQGHRKVLIAEAEGQKVLHDNFIPATPGQFDLRIAGKSLFNRAAG